MKFLLLDLNMIKRKKKWKSLIIYIFLYIYIYIYIYYVLFGNPFGQVKNFAQLRADSQTVKKKFHVFNVNLTPKHCVFDPEKARAVIVVTYCE